MRRLGPALLAATVLLVFALAQRLGFVGGGVDSFLLLLPLAAVSAFGRHRPRGGCA